jgi:hypothetical protein
MVYGWLDAFQRSCCLCGETAGTRILRLKSTFRTCSHDRCYLGLLCSPPSLSKTCTVANEQGALEKSWSTALTERPTAWLTMRYPVSEANVLGEGELQNRCALHLFLFENTRNNPRVRKRKRPVTPCVPARLD